ncbi:hypothetical protein L5515_010622 [Caenorhabditis briggsae]|uniref:Uncharacterized protein n=1 Tax=Caenorhabditis briggsae TaxID=6238 RepID=A0AAE9JG37_CAEBR|nr:hypothetical protein L3Y34_003469 [Caenorhabditis briggsae]UMM27250.1 hypothetical protein L5515_010622 [Caenorhabditis briggsae]
MVPDDVEPMEVDDDGALIVDLNETVEEDEETKKEKKRRKRFREKLKRFDHYSQFSGISIAQIDWPLIQGRSLQRSPLTGQSFNADFQTKTLSESTNGHERRFSKSHQPSHFVLVPPC